MPFVLTGGQSEVYRRFAIASGDKVDVEGDVVVTGDVHAHGDVKTGKDSRIEGDCLGRGAEAKIEGEVTGDVEEGAPRVPLPALPTEAELRALADRVLEGNQKLTDLGARRGALRRWQGRSQRLDRRPRYAASDGGYPSQRHARGFRFSYCSVAGLSRRYSDRQGLGLSRCLAGRGENRDREGRVSSRVWPLPALGVTAATVTLTATATATADSDSDGDSDADSDGDSDGDSDSDSGASSGTGEVKVKKGARLLFVDLVPGTDGDTAPPRLRIVSRDRDHRDRRSQALGGV